LYIIMVSLCSGWELILSEPQAGLLNETAKEKFVQIIPAISRAPSCAPSDRSSGATQAVCLLVHYSGLIAHGTQLCALKPWIMTRFRLLL
jgi:hypothetical protein